jgi:hypothetical protein
MQKSQMPLLLVPAMHIPFRLAPPLYATSQLVTEALQHVLVKIIQEMQKKLPASTDGPEVTVTDVAVRAHKRDRASELEFKAVDEV